MLLLLIALLLISESPSIFLPPFESSKLGGNYMILSSVLEILILSALFVLDKMYKISTLLLSLVFFSPYENK